MSNVKQVIVIRSDLKMRRGKEIAQACHSSNVFLVQTQPTSFAIWCLVQAARFFRFLGFKVPTEGQLHLEPWTPAEIEWLEGSFTKVCVKATSEDQLVHVHDQAQLLGLKSALITDNGLTEFHGVKTKTAVAIGPDDAEKIDQVTGSLSLY